MFASCFSFGILLVNKNFFNAHVKISGNFERQLNFAGSFGFYKNQRKQELLSVKGKNGKEKPLLHGCVCFHVAAVGAILIQLKFQSDKVEFILEITAMLF